MTSLSSDNKDELILQYAMEFSSIFDNESTDVIELGQEWKASTDPDENFVTQEDTAQDDTADLGSDWIELHEEMSQIWDFGIRRARPKRKGSQNVDDDDEEASSSLYVLTFSYISDTIHGLEGKKKPITNVSIGYWLLGISFIIGMIQLSILLLLAYYYCTIAYGQNGFLYWFNFLGNSTSYATNTGPPNGQTTTCGEIMIDSDPCGSMFPTQTYNAAFGGSICLYMDSTDYDRGNYLFNSDAVEGNTCASCYFYLTEGAYNSQSVWPAGTDQYCSTVVCSASAVWHPLYLVAIPVSIMTVMLTICSQLRELQICHVMGHSSHSSHETTTWTSIFLRGMLKCVIWLQQYWVGPYIVIITVDYMLQSPDPFSIVGNAVSIVFLIQMDTAFVQALCTSKRAQSLLETKATVKMSLEDSHHIGRRLKITTVVVILATGFFVIYQILTPCTYYKVQAEEYFLFLLAFITLIGPQVYEAHYSLRKSQLLSDKGQAIQLKNFTRAHFLVSWKALEVWVPTLLPIAAIIFSTDFAFYSSLSGMALMIEFAFAVIVFHYGYLIMILIGCALDIYNAVSLACLVWRSKTVVVDYDKQLITYSKGISAKTKRRISADFLVSFVGVLATLLASFCAIEFSYTLLFWLEQVPGLNLSSDNVFVVLLKKRSDAMSWYVPQSIQKHEFMANYTVMVSLWAASMVYIFVYIVWVRGSLSTPLLPYHIAGYVYGASMIIFFVASSLNIPRIPTPSPQQ